MFNKKIFSERFTAILSALGLTDKAKKAKDDPNALSGDWAAIAAKYKEEYGTDFADDLHAASSEPEENSISTDDITTAMTILNSALTSGSVTNANDPEAAAPAEGETAAATHEENAAGKPEKPVAKAPTGQELIQAATNMANALKIVANQAAPDQPEAVSQGMAVVALTGDPNDTKHLFGIPHEMYAVNSRWNQITLDPRKHAVMSAPTEDDAVSFRKEVKTYSASLAARFSYLHDRNLLSNPKQLAAGAFSNDYTGLSSANLGSQYLVRRQDALLAQVIAAREVNSLFPVRYGVQDRTLMISAFFTEVSQAYQKGEVYKGGMTLEPEMGHTDKAMIKTLFGPMDEIETMYIGYLNKEGSNPIKWSMIEFCMLNLLLQAQSEQNIRAIKGIYVKPEANIPGSFLNSATGVIYTVIRYYHEMKLRLISDASFKTYTEADMLDTVKAFCRKVETSANIRTTNIRKMKIYLNELHQGWWQDNIRTAYGLQTDFKGPDSYANIVPDTMFRIEWVPNLDSNDHPMIIQTPGNIQRLEFIAGEMMSVGMDQQMEMVRFYSYWKEGCAADFVGIKFASRAALLANNFKWQQIFMNKFSIAVAADATTLDATKGFWFETAANTQATALTDIVGAEPGVGYIIECSGLANATTIAKSGKFATLTAAFTPTALEDYIMVILNSEGNFLELERCVGGTRTINTALQPNIPGAR